MTTPKPGMRITTARLVVFVVGLISVITLLFDALSSAGVTWWTLYKILLASGLALGGVLWVRSRARPKAGA